MPDTFVKIASVTVGSGGASSIDFTAIPSTYTDLVVKTSLRDNTSNTATDLYMTFNSSTSGYSSRILFGNGSNAFSYTGVTTAGQAGVIDTSTKTANTFSSTDIYIPNYAGSNNKSYSADSVLEDNATYGRDDLFAGLWSNTAAITAIKLAPSSGSFVQYSTAVLYGIKNS